MTSRKLEISMVQLQQKLPVPGGWNCNINSRVVFWALQAACLHHAPRLGPGITTHPGDNCVQAAEHSQWPMKTPLASSHARTGRKLAGSSHPQLPPQTAQIWQPLTFHTTQRTLFTSWCFNSLAHLILTWLLPPLSQAPQEAIRTSKV